MEQNEEVTKGIHTENVGGKTVFVGEGETPVEATEPAPGTPNIDYPPAPVGSVTNPFSYTPYIAPEAADVEKGINIRLDVQRATSGIKVFTAITQLEGKSLQTVKVFIDGAQRFSLPSEVEPVSQFSWEGVFEAGVESTVLVQVSDEDGNVASSVKTISLMT